MTYCQFRTPGESLMTYCHLTILTINFLYFFSLFLILFLSISVYLFFIRQECLSQLFEKRCSLKQYVLIADVILKIFLLVVEDERGAELIFFLLVIHSAPTEE